MCNTSLKLHDGAFNIDAKLFSKYGLITITTKSILKRRFHYTNHVPMTKMILASCGITQCEVIKNEDPANPFYRTD